MTRHRRFQQDSMICHVIIRCNNRHMLLSEGKTKMLLLESFGHYQKRLGFKVYGFVIMDNHAHWLIQVKGIQGLSVLMQRVLLSFGQKYRKDNAYVGHFWQGRYKSRAVISDQVILEVLRYIHENPSKAGIVDDFKDYVYSSAYKYFDLTNKKINGVIEITKYGDTSVGSVSLLTL